MQLYTIPLPERDEARPQDARAAQIQQAGLLDAGIDTQKVGAEEADLTRDGQWRYGERFGNKVARELETLASSDYSAIPLYDPDAADLGKQAGYYEVERADITPAQAATEDVFEFSVGLSLTGTRETHWRAVETTSETISHGLATGASGLIGIPAAATKTRWYTQADGTKVASATRTVTAEFGRIALFDPSASSFDDPTLIYQVAYDRERDTDVLVYDERDREKYWTFEADDTDVGTDAHVGTATVSGGEKVNQWTHIFDPSAEFSGDPVVDNGLFRLRFDEDTGLLRAFQWDGSEWDHIRVNAVDYHLLDADVERIGPAQVDVYCAFEAVSDGTLSPAVLSIQRGIDRAVVRETTNTTLPSDLETMLSPIASDQTTDVQPAQSVRSRQEVKG